MTTLGIIQVRLDSTRLPSKALLPVMGRPMLGLLYERMARAKSLDRLVIATSVEPSDAPILDFARGAGLEAYAGSKLDLVDRFKQGIEAYRADKLVLVTGDCPLVDPDLVDRAVALLADSPGVDMVTNAATFTWPDGLDVMAFPAASVLRAWDQIADPVWREWVVAYMRDNPNEFCVRNFESDEDLSRFRWTVDYADDYEFVQHVYHELYPVNPTFTTRDILDLLERKPELLDINAGHIANEGYDIMMASQRAEQKTER